MLCVTDLPMLVLGDLPSPIQKEQAGRQTVGSGSGGGVVFFNNGMADRRAETHSNHTAAS